jgi:opacity protein-like surface antigen
MMIEGRAKTKLPNQGAVMRRLFVVLGLLASTCGAYAQEFELPTLRGSDLFVPDAPVIYSRWDGFYAGGHVGYGFANMNFATSTQDLVAHELRLLALENEQHVSTWQVLGQANTHSPSGGVFLGYNIGWECVILGFEANYNRLNVATADAPMAPIERLVTAGGNVYDVKVAGSASMRLMDFATLRTRAGYEVGNFLPYAMVGAAVARADLARSASVSGRQNPPPATSPPTPCGPPQSPNCVPFSFSETDTKTGAFIYGWAIGGGLDVFVLPQVFLRAEYEYVAFLKAMGIQASMQTARAGIGLKF